MIDQTEISPDELKPCPFCGSIPRMHKDSWDTPTGKARRWWIKCGTCGSSSDEYRTPKDAFLAWQRRSNR